MPCGLHQPRIVATECPHMPRVPDGTALGWCPWTSGAPDNGVANLGSGLTRNQMGYCAFITGVRYTLDLRVWGQNSNLNC